jgi:rhodanese-related sulfurtransferase
VAGLQNAESGCLIVKFEGPRETQDEFSIFVPIIQETMRFVFSAILLMVLPLNGFCQKKQDKLDRTLKKFNHESVPYMQVDALHGMHHVLLLDTREKEEYEVSHLQNALWVGDKTFELDSVTSKITDKDTEIVVYCSIGVRSENIGEKLKEAGYSNVKNLYGGIFEWKNQGYPVYGPEGNETEKVHAFSKHWGKLLKKGEKVYGTADDGSSSGNPK